MAQKGKGGLLGHLRIDYARSPEIGITDIQKRGMPSSQPSSRAMARMVGMLTP